MCVSQLHEMVSFTWLIIVLFTAFAVAQVPSPHYRSDGVIVSRQVAEYWYKRSIQKRDTDSSSPSFDYSSEKVYGVSLGGWLITEPYITPSLYRAAITDNETDAQIPVDEYHYCKKLGTSECYNRLHEHWDTFINGSDFKKIKEWGLNTVRLPIGYWAFARLKNDTFCFGQEEYLEKAIEWCRENNLHMLLDLHGMPGSQNGFDNSGLRDQVNWLNVTTNFNLGFEVLNYIQNKYGQPEYYDVISGIENVNEPLGPKINMSRLKNFDRDSYAQMRSVGSDNYFTFHDAFMNATYWNNVFQSGHNISENATYSASIYNILIDHHRYEVFSTGQLLLNISGHIDSLKDFTSGIVNDEKIPVKVIGEWSAALSDCATWLNGVGRGSRYEGQYSSSQVVGKCSYSNDYSKMTSQNRTDTRKLVEAQLDLYNETNGFIFWCYKTENAIEFDLSKLIEYDLFPQPLTARKYPNVLKSSATSLVNSPSNRLLLMETAVVMIIISLI
ncbi:DEKNAAC101664 [Brettanomyces naardenensis]|uniref:glucan 1,3-beta-glucosidase n=1 Tax=Brettanomyces naardenensis TaxID=13370 RepID=A0A448YIQ4_BRENA|nr:DEKNAAC101664 [Brettanomyces naardenensis]